MRLITPKARLEAFTSRPFLLYAIGRKSNHAGQTHLAITSLHAVRAWAKSCFSRIHAILEAIRHTVAQLAERLLALYYRAHHRAGNRCKAAPPAPNYAARSRGLRNLGL